VLVDECAGTVCNIVQIRPKTLHNFSRLYGRYLMPIPGSMSVDNVDVVDLQQKLHSPPSQYEPTFGKKAVFDMTIKESR